MADTGFNPWVLRRRDQRFLQRRFQQPPPRGRNRVQIGRQFITERQQFVHPGDNALLLGEGREGKCK